MKELTPEMMNFLLDCQGCEIQKLEPVHGIAKNCAAKGLLQRGLLDAKPFVNKDGKVCMGYFITSSGKEYLGSQNIPANKEIFTNDN